MECTLGAIGEIIKKENEKEGKRKKILKKKEETGNVEKKITYMED